MIIYYFTLHTHLYTIKEKNQDKKKTQMNYFLPHLFHSKCHDKIFVTAQQPPQHQQQNNQNYSLVETPPATYHRNSKLHDRAEIEQCSENKSF